MDELLNKYNHNVIKNLDKNNLIKIVNFLKDNHCDFIEDILNDYLDIFTFEYKEFINKYIILNNKYNGLFLNKASKDMNLLEEFYYV